MKVQILFLLQMSNTEFLSSLAFPKTETKLIDI